MILHKSNVRKRFNSEGLQVGIKTLNLIEDLINRHIQQMIDMAKDLNIKRVNPHDVGHLLETPIRDRKIYGVSLDEQECKKCKGIPETQLNMARVITRHVEMEATKLLSRWQKSEVF